MYLYLNNHAILWVKVCNYVHYATYAPLQGTKAQDFGVGDFEAVPKAWFFLTCRDKIHFFCLRHLIEKFGSGSFIGPLVRRLSFSSTWEQFFSEIGQCVFDIKALAAKQLLTIKKNTVTSDLLRKFPLTYRALPGSLKKFGILVSKSGNKVLKRFRFS
jgi:hypothetical protein